MVREHFSLEDVKLPYTGLGVNQEEFEAIMDQEIKGEQSVTGLSGPGVSSKVNTVVSRSKIE
jgi:hypothetical protein